ncbi:MAG: hypothetical protein IJA15_04140 [Clostridia bacterium]|nr:hypothetical protein [Clostridia bacterium]
MLNHLFENYEAFYTMLTSTMVTSNRPSGTFNEDCNAMIDFIGSAYALSEEAIKSCKECIYVSLAPISLVVDKKAIFSNRQYTEYLSDVDVLNDIKCSVISFLERLSKSNAPSINPDWFDYNHYFSYNARVRYEELKVAASGGNVVINRHIGLLLALGIGVERDLEESATRLKRCVLWGDIPSIKLLAKVYELQGKKEIASTVKEIAQLAEKYLHAGYTVIPEEIASKYSQQAVNYYSIISSVLQDVVYAFNKQNIDFSFVEAISSEGLDYYKRMYYVNNYQRTEWKDVTNSAYNPAKKIGFK